jgi:hypothetical protein
MLARTQLTPVTVLVFNYSDASPSTLKIAEQQAGWIFRKAGLQVSWIRCPVPLTPDSDQACGAQVTPNDIRLRIVNFPEHNYFGESVFGFTVAPAVATVYYGPALRAARNDWVDHEVPAFLGCIMAHEIGHLLLGPGAHASTGIMQSHWKKEHIEQAMKSQLLFTAEEAARIRSNAASRLDQPVGIAKADFAALNAPTHVRHREPMSSREPRR